MGDIGLQEGRAPSAAVRLGRVGLFGKLLTAVRHWIFECPRCVNHPLRRSKARGREFLLALFLFRSYRCHGCNRRYWRPRFRI